MVINPPAHHIDILMEGDSVTTEMVVHSLLCKAAILLYALLYGIPLYFPLC